MSKNGIVVYDLEIKKAIEMNPEKRIAGIEYCEGWNDYTGMGISVLCAYDYLDRRSRVFTDSNKDEFAKLVANRGVVVGFNNTRFDNNVVKACWGIEIPQEKNYDILVELWAGLGLGPEFKKETHSGFSLDQCASVNLGTQKSGNGAMAPVDWQQWKIGDVIDYCLMDVEITKRLLDRIMFQGFLLNPRDPKTIIEIRKP